MNALVPTDTNPLVPTSMDEAIRLAKAMASAKLVPKHLQDDPGSCLLIVEQAMRWKMSPFAVAQCTSVIGGKIMWEGKLVAAAVESSGAIEGHFDYKYDGEGDDRRVTVSAKRVGEQNPRQLTIHLRDVRTSNEWWRKQPDQQLAYSGVRNWARRYTPAALLGVYAPEEFDRSTGTVVDHEGPAIEAEETPPTNETKPQRAAAASIRRADKIAEKAPAYEAGDPPPPSPERTREQWQSWLQKLHSALAVLSSRAEVVELAGRKTVGDAIADGPQWVRDEISALLAEAYARFPEGTAPDEDPFADTEEDAPHIVGEENVLAG